MKNWIFRKSSYRQKTFFKKKLHGARVPFKEHEFYVIFCK